MSIGTVLPIRLSGAGLAKEPTILARSVKHNVHLYAQKSKQRGRTE